MAKFFKAQDSDKVVMVLEGDVTSLECDGKKMVELIPDSVEAAKEKHIPDVTIEENGRVKVQVGSTLHPMLEAHYIGFVAAVNKDSAVIKYLKPGDEPVVHFCPKHGKFTDIYAWCNIHGLWVKHL